MRPLLLAPITICIGSSLCGQDTWTRAAPTAHASARFGHALAYDSHRGVVVMFGGTDTTKIADTWEYDGLTWTRINTSSVPARRSHHAMVYDSDRKVIVLFGGSGPSGGLADTWEYDGTTWTLLGNGGPPPRTGTAMVYDNIRQRTVLFGGQDSNGFRNDTWEWDGKSWSAVSTKTPPPSTAGHAMAFHELIGRVVVTRGDNKQQETWSYDGIDWLRHAPVGNPGDNNGAPMTYDSGRNRLVLVIGARTETWEYVATLKTPAATGTFGLGCAGVAGVPKLAFGLPPYIGAPVSLELTTLPQSTFAIAFLHLGSSSQSWGALTLPWNLGPLGAPSCQLLVSPDLLVTTKNNGGSANLRATVPADPSLVGQTAYAQGFVLDATANALGAAISNGVAGKFGQRW